MTNRLLLGILLGTGAGATALVTACSGSSGYSSNSAPTHGASAHAGSSAAVVVAVRDGVLVAPDGHTLYENTVDTASSVSCTGACASAWPPLVGTPHAGAGVDAAGLVTLTRPDGATQVVYDGHPLYEFSGDKAAGDHSGDGLADGGGTWHVARAEGADSPSPAASSPTSSSRYGY